jgi:glyoxylase-like metal-dependent hydrolase (beta-lactamase superfamily II)
VRFAVSPGPLSRRKKLAHHAAAKRIKVTELFVRSTLSMLQRKPIISNVIEMNHQIGHIIGCCVYLIYDADEWILIDVGYEDTVDEVVEIIRQLDFPFSRCRGIIATHADVDHVQGLAKLKRILRAPVSAHPNAVEALTTGDRLSTFAEIPAQEISMEMPPVGVDHQINEGDVIQVGNLELQVWWTPGHTNSQLALRMGKLLFSGDNIFRDGCVGAIEAHHGSNLPLFIKSLERIRDADVAWLLPSHGPPLRHDRDFLNGVIQRVKGYQHMADFGTCAVDWPLIDRWEKELLEGKPIE